MNTSSRTVSIWSSFRFGSGVSSWLLSTALGVALLAALSRIAIPLPGTPVPVTGQTFGVALLALLWGRKRGMAAVATYLGLGFAGMPVFAKAHLPFVVGPTSGYLVGMLAGAFVMGFLSDRGWTRRFGTAWLAAIAGSVCVFTGGLVGLSLWMPGAPLSAVLAAGWIPFIPGDVLKTGLAALVASRAAADTTPPVRRQ